MGKIINFRLKKTYDDVINEHKKKCIIKEFPKEIYETINDFDGLLEDINEDNFKLIDKNYIEKIECSLLIKDEYYNSF